MDFNVDYKAPPNLNTVINLNEVNHIQDHFSTSVYNNDSYLNSNPIQYLNGLSHVFQYSGLEHSDCSLDLQYPNINSLTQSYSLNEHSIFVPQDSLINFPSYAMPEESLEFNHSDISMNISMTSVCNQLNNSVKLNEASNENESFKLLNINASNFHNSCQVMEINGSVTDQNNILQSNNHIALNEVFNKSEDESADINKSFVILETPSKNSSSINSTPVKSIGTLNTDLEFPYNNECLTYNTNQYVCSDSSHHFTDLICDKASLSQEAIQFEGNFNTLNCKKNMDTNDIEKSLSFTHDLSSEKQLSNLSRDDINKESIMIVPSTSKAVLNTPTQCLNLGETSEHDVTFQTPEQFNKMPTEPIITTVQVYDKFEQTPDETNSENSTAFLKKNVSFNLDETYNTKAQNLSYSQLSPDMFSEDECEESTMKGNLSTLEEISPTQKLLLETQSVHKLDRKILRRVKESLLGVLPPPSVTISKLNVSDILDRINKNQHLFVFNDSKSKNPLCANELIDDENKITANNGMKSLLINSNKHEVDNTSWPEVTQLSYHGLHYNRTKISEDIEYYCQCYGQRYVGSETASSCTIWSLNAPSSASKRKNLKKMFGQQSPGRRLSHLAKRRIAFSKDNLYSKTSSSVLAPTVLSKRQLMIDTRYIAESQKIGKSPRKRCSRKRISPRKRTPRKTPNAKSPHKKVKTPCSSSKKRAVRKLLMSENDSEPVKTTSRLSVSKRALFQSPEIKTNVQISSAPIKMKTPESKKTLKSKRALFSSPIEETNIKKRKRSDADDDFSPQRSKLSKSLSNNDILTKKINSCKLPRHSSEQPISISKRTDLSDIHKKKLLWAVSEALRSQNICMSHPQFKTFAATLARVVRKQMPDLMSGGTKTVGSTSERMARIAHAHVFSVVKGKTADEIIEKIDITLKNITNSKKIGYIPPSRPSSVLSDASQKINLDSIESNTFKLNCPETNQKSVLDSIENQYINTNCNSVHDKLSSLNSSAAGTVNSVICDKLINVSCGNNENNNPECYINRYDYEKTRIKRQIKFDALDGSTMPS